MIKLFKGKGIKKSNLGRKSNKIFKAFFLLILLIILISSALFVYKYATVNKINISLENISCVGERELENDLNIRGKNILLINEFEIDSKIKQKYFCVESIEMSKAPLWVKRGFSEVDIKVVGAKPALIVNLWTKSIFPDLGSLEASPSSQTAVLKINTSPESAILKYAVSKRGVVLSEGGLIDGLPDVFYVIEEINIGDFLGEKKIQNILKILEGFKNLSLAPEQKIVEGEVFVAIGQPQILMSLAKDPLRQTASLQLILQKAKMDSKQVEKIDLRFERPVVVYVPKKR